MFSLWEPAFLEDQQLQFFLLIGTYSTPESNSVYGKHSVTGIPFRDRFILFSNRVIFSTRDKLSNRDTFKRPVHHIQYPGHSQLSGHHLKTGNSQWLGHHLKTRTFSVSATSFRNRNILSDQDIIWKPGHSQWPVHHLKTGIFLVTGTSFRNRDIFSNRCIVVTW